MIFHLIFILISSQLKITMFLKDLKFIFIKGYMAIPNGTSFSSRVKFILRTISYSIKLRSNINKKFS